MTAQPPLGILTVSRHVQRVVAHPAGEHPHGGVDVAGAHVTDLYLRGHALVGLALGALAFLELLAQVGRLLGPALVLLLLGVGVGLLRGLVRGGFALALRDPQLLCGGVVRVSRRIVSG